ncbi:MAG: GNAT family N-acetyltransferase [bacterium]
MNRTRPRGGDGPRASDRALAVSRAPAVGRARSLALTFAPATAARWADVERLFGARGACGGCWCMAWRLSRAKFDAGKGDANKRALRKLVMSANAPGVLAYAGGEPVGWCAVAPRAIYPALERSRVLAPVDDAEVWSISCLFVAKSYRNRGVSSRLLRAAAEFAREQGARIVEGYPVETRAGRLPDPFVWTGIPAAFARAGFAEVLRRSPARPIMRRTMRPRA